MNEKKIKQAFLQYRNNTKRLSGLEFVSLRGVDSSRQRTRKGAKGFESSLVGYIADKIEIEKSVEMVRRTLYHYEILERAYADGKAAFIRCRYVQGMSFTRAAVECGLPESTACKWLKEIIETAAAIAEIYSLL